MKKPRTRDPGSIRVPAPAAPPDPRAVPATITFFLTAAQRREVLERLRRLHPQRDAALLAALRIPLDGETA